MIGIILGSDYPETCSGCKLFCDDSLNPFCPAGGGYTSKEIEEEENGSLAMYYDGCLSHRPKNCPLCPLKEVFFDDGGDPDAH